MAPKLTIQKPHTHPKFNIPIFLQKPKESKRTKEIMQQKAKELFESLNLFASDKETTAEMLRLDEKNKQLFEEINKRLAEMKGLMPAIKVQK